MQQDTYSPSSVPTTFLFDIGKVLLDFDFESSLIRLMPEAILNPHERIRHILEQKDALETGLIDPIHYADWALQILGSNATREQFYQAWQQIFRINEPMWQCIRKLADANHTLILISNINAIHAPWIFTAYPEFSFFQHKVLSYEIGILKPDPAIYRYVIDTFRLNPALTVYIDDQPQNILAGKALKLQCWKYEIHDHLAFENWLEKKLRNTKA